MSAYFKLSGKLRLFAQSLKMFGSVLDSKYKTSCHDFHWNVFESTGVVFWSLLNWFDDFSFFKFTKSKYFFTIMMFLNFFDRMVFKV